MLLYIGTTIEAKDCLSGCRSGATILYRSHGYPNHPIGPAQFTWRPKNDKITLQRQLWLLIHPAITDSLIKEVKENIRTDSVIVNNLQDELVHYKLIGPRSNDVIVQTLDPVWSAVDDEGITEEGKWTRQGNDGVMDKKKFLEYLCNTKTPAELPNKIVVGLNVQDFRLSIPDKKVNIASPIHDVTSINNAPVIVTPKLSQCHIWNKMVRGCAKQSLVPEHQLNEICSERLQDVSKELKELECYLPVLLLHQTVDAVGIGWDILVPAGWGKPLWLSLVYRGARVIGFEEIKQCHLEQLLLHYPVDFPDTDSGQQLELNNLKMLQSKYCKYPPDKRPNFGKLNSSSPFLPAWSSVISCYGDMEKELDDITMLPVTKKAKLSPSKREEASYYVLRSVKHLVSLSKLVNKLKETTEDIPSEEDWPSVISNMELSTLVVDHSESLVAVFFTMCHRGNPGARSMLCIPSIEDLLKLSNDKSYYGPVELLNKKGVCIPDNDKLVIGTTLLTNKAFKLAKKELQIQKASKSQDLEMFKDFSIQSVANDSVTSTLKLQPLQPSHPVIGYATSAGYVFSQGKGSGVAFCSLTGLMELMKFCYLQNHPVTTLVREHDSLQYRFAYVDILQNHC